MKIAILGATSQIAKDLVRFFDTHNSYELVLFARRPEVVTHWMNIVELENRYTVSDFSQFTTDEHFDAILNFVGVGDPAQVASMGATIFDVTNYYDEMVLSYLRQRTDCRYIFLSSGAAYGSNFDAPVDENSKATIAINNFQPQDWYAVSKLYAEFRHRSLTQLSIVDVRVFNYFSNTQNMDARFFITDLVRALRDNTVLNTSSANIVRDYLHPSDFYRLIEGILTSKPVNLSVDCYSKAPVEKSILLEACKRQFGLKYQIYEDIVGIIGTGIKPFYYSLNTQAKVFGYDPHLTSLEGIFFEIEKIFKS